MYWNNPFYLTVNGARIGIKKSKSVNAKWNEITILLHKVLLGRNKSYTSENLYNSRLTKPEQHN